MSYHIRPILSALLRNRTGAVLVSLQIAIALAVLANGIYIVKQRWDYMRQPIGIDADNIFVVMTEGFTRDYNHELTLREDLAYLRSVDGVVAATTSHHFPMSSSVWDNNLASEPTRTASRVSADFYNVDDQFVAAMGSRVIRGRNFRPDEILPPLPKSAASDFVPSVIVTQRFAEQMFPNQNAVGKTVYARPDQPATIIGIIENMKGGRPELSFSGNVVLAPRLPGPADAPFTYYMVRTQPGRLNSVLRTVEEHLTKSNPDRMIDYVRPISAFVDYVYRDDRNTSIFLAVVTGLLLVVTALGVFGLATFNVSTRTKQIGTRRALGASRQDIIRYFMVENWLVTSIGVVVGCALAVIGGYALTLQYGLPRLNLGYLLGGVLALWSIGLAAAWKPARRASSISPAIATRTV